MKTIKSIYLIVFLLVTGAVFAENKKPGALVRSTLKGLEYRIKAGVIKWFDRNRKWGGLFGIRLENKGMKTDARVKNYYMVMDSYDGEVLGHVEGNWTGNVKTNVKNSYITLPFQVIYKVSPRWDLKFGPYISILTNGDFSGVDHQRPFPVIVADLYQTGQSNDTADSPIGIIERSQGKQGDKKAGNQGSFQVRNFITGSN